MTNENREQMILENVGLVKYLARKIAGPNNDEDAVQVGYLGLIHAVDHFDNRRGTKFSTYAYFCIKGYIQSCLLKKQKKNTISGIRIVPLCEDDTSCDTNEEYVESDSRNYVFDILKRHLDAKRFDIIYRCFVLNKTDAETGKELEISKERVRQLKRSGLQQILNRVPDLVELLTEK